MNLSFLTSKVLRPWRRRDHQLTFELDQGNGRLLPLSPVLGMYALSTVLTVGTVFKDASWIEQCGVENNWTECVTETVTVSTQSYEILAVGAKMCCFSVPKTSLTSKFPFLFNPLSTNMDCSASFFSHFLPSMHRGQYENQHGTSQFGGTIKN